MDPLLTVENLNKSFKNRGKLLPVVRDLSFTIGEGEALGLIGESGCGKSTVASLIAGFLKPDGGRIFFDGQLLSYKGRQAQLCRKDMQMIFQDPRSQMNPRMTVRKNLEEAVIYYEPERKEHLEPDILAGLAKMGLPGSYIDKYPSELSGGECQRVAIARALMRKPKLLICDEITSALDVSVQAEIIRCLLELKEQEKLSFLFISHDPALAGLFCDRIIELTG